MFRETSIDTLKEFFDLLPTLATANHVSATRPTTMDNNVGTLSLASDSGIQHMLDNNVGTFSRTSNSGIQ